MRAARWIERAVDAVVLVVIVPLLLLPLAVGGGVVLFASAGATTECPGPCEGPGQLGMLLWAALVLVVWAAYRPLLRRLGRRTAGQFVSQAFARRHR